MSEEDCMVKLQMAGRIFRCMRLRKHIGVHRHCGLTDGVTDKTKAFILEWADDAILPTYITKRFKAPNAYQDGHKQLNKSNIGVEIDNEEYD